MADRRSLLSGSLSIRVPEVYLVQYAITGFSEDGDIEGTDKMEAMGPGDTDKLDCDLQELLDNRPFECLRCSHTFDEPVDVEGLEEKDISVETYVESPEDS